MQVRNGWGRDKFFSPVDEQNSSFEKKALSFALDGDFSLWP